jgi:DnaJ-class molecular chaperone
LIERSVHQPEVSGTPTTEARPPTHERRTCAACLGTGYVTDHSTYNERTGLLVLCERPCEACGGEGAVLCWLYPKPSPRTKRLPCVLCGERVRVNEAVEVGEEDADRLLLLEGDYVCRPCAAKEGVER